MRKKEKKNEHTLCKLWFELIMIQTEKVYKMFLWLNNSNKKNELKIIFLYFVNL